MSDSYNEKNIITALRGAANGIASAIDNETISGDEAFRLLSVIADSFEAQLNKDVDNRIQDLSNT